MTTLKLKDIRCKKCNFLFRVSQSHIELEGCYAPAYCEQNQDNPRNPHKYLEAIDGR